MTDRRVRIHISTTSTPIPTPGPELFDVHTRCTSSSSFFSQQDLHDCAAFKQSSRIATDLCPRPRSPPIRADSSDPYEASAGAATVSRLARFVYRNPTPTRSERARSVSVLSMPRAATPGAARRGGVDRHRSRSASTDVSGIQDVSESQWEQVVSSKSDPVRVSSSSRPLSGVVEVEGESEGEDRDIDDHLGARPSMGKQEGSSSKRRKIDTPSKPRSRFRSISLAASHRQPTSPLYTQAPHPRRPTDQTMLHSSPRSVNTNGETDGYANSMIDDHPISSIISDEEPDPESEAIMSRVSQSSPVRRERGRSRRIISPDEDDEPGHEGQVGSSGRSVHVRSAKKRRISIGSNTDTASQGHTDKENRSRADTMSEEEAVDWTPSPPSQRVRARPALSDSHRRPSSSRRAAVSARAAAKKYVVLSDEEDGEFDPDKGSEDGSDADGRLESAFERQYRKELAAESEGTEEDDGYDDDPDEGEAEEEIMELGTAFQVYDEEDVAADVVVDTDPAMGTADEEDDVARAIRYAEAMESELEPDHYQVEEDEYGDMDDFFAGIDPDALISSSATDLQPQLFKGDAASNGVSAALKPATSDDVFNSPPPPVKRYHPNSHAKSSGTAPAPPSSGPSAASRSLPLSALLETLDTPISATSASATGAKGSAQSKSAKGKAEGKATTTTATDDPSSSPTAAAIQAAKDGFIRVSIMPPREAEFYGNHWRRGQEGVAKAPMRLTDAARKRAEAVGAMLVYEGDDTGIGEAEGEFGDEIDWDDVELSGPQGPQNPGAVPAYNHAPWGTSSRSTGPAKKSAPRTSAAGTTKRKSASSTQTTLLQKTQKETYEDEFDFDGDEDLLGPQGRDSSKGRGRGRGRGGWGRGGWAKRGAAKKRGAARAKK